MVLEYVITIAIVLAAVALLSLAFRRTLTGKGCWSCGMRSCCTGDSPHPAPGQQDHAETP